MEPKLKPKIQQLKAETQQLEFFLAMLNERQSANPNPKEDA